jgi:dienelactone hydrolase
MKNLAPFTGLAVLAALSLHSITASAAITITEEVFAGPDSVTLNAVLYLPDSYDPEATHEAVVMLHGCSGMWSSSNYGAYSGGVPNLMNNVDKWGIKLANEGIVAVAVDSFTPRTPVGVTEDDFQHQCSGDTHAGVVNPYTTRVLDARAAYDYLVNYGGIDPAHIGLLGWSHGAQAALVEAAATIPTSNTTRSDHVFSSTVVFYPGCGLALDFVDTSNVANSYWRPQTHLRMNIGESDSLYANCDTRMDIAIAAPYNAPVEYESYPGAGHSFDGGSQTWPASTCGTANNTCAMNDADIDSFSFFQSHL